MNKFSFGKYYKINQLLPIQLSPITNHRLPPIYRSLGQTYRCLGNVLNIVLIDLVFGHQIGFFNIKKMKNNTRIYLWAAIGLLSVSNYSFGSGEPKKASSVKAAQLTLQNQGMLFQENKGQLADPFGKVLSNIFYYGSEGNVAVYCESTKLSFVFTRVNMKNEEATANTDIFSKDSKPENITIDASRLELEFLGANQAAQIIAGDKQVLTSNYFQAHTGVNGITGIRSYKKLTYKNIYPNIDMMLSTSGHGLEYSFLVHPGGNVSDIKLQWNGADETKSIENGGISYSNTIGSMNESKPMSFVEGKGVASNFTMQGNERGFNVVSYDKSKDLLIDPTLTWATYYGGSGNETGRAVATDASGNVYITGHTTSTSGIATSGAFKTSFAGSADAFIAKFSSSGSRLW